MDETVELKVEMSGCTCEQRIKKGLAKLKGIDKVEVDGSHGKVVVSGCLNKNKVLKAVIRTGLRAEFWSSQSEALLNTYAAGCYHCLGLHSVA